MAASATSIIIISHPQDSLSASIAMRLQSQGVRILNLSPGTLGSSQVTLQGDLFSIDGETVSGVIFRVPPETTFSDEFEPSDQPFSDAEMRAIWLAALNLESMLAVNKYDAMAWFEGLGWPTWRRRLIQAGIPVSNFQVGDVSLPTLKVWYPYTSQNGRTTPGPDTRRILGAALTENNTTQNSFMVGRNIVAGKQTDSILAAADLLADSGVWIASIATDLNDRILTVDTLPMVSDIDVENRICTGIAEIFYAHLHRWRL